MSKERISSFSPLIQALFFWWNITTWLNAEEVIQWNNKVDGFKEGSFSKCESYALEGKKGDRYKCLIERVGFRSEAERK